MRWRSPIGCGKRCRQLTWLRSCEHSACCWSNSKPVQSASPLQKLWRNFLVPRRCVLLMSLSKLKTPKSYASGSAQMRAPERFPRIDRAPYGDRNRYYGNRVRICVKRICQRHWYATACIDCSRQPDFSAYRPLGRNYLILSRVALPRNRRCSGEPAHNHK